MSAGRLMAYLRFQLYRHGWLALAGLVLVVAGITTQLVVVEGMRTQAAELRTGQVALRQQLFRLPAALNTGSERLAAFHAGLPGAPGALEAIDTIHRSAAAHGVSLSNGEYRLARDASGRWLRYQITLPARAGYLSLRAWLAELMNALPAAALDELSLRRDDVGSGEVEARVRLTLFLRAP